jgi:hypothetical protein
MKTRFVPALALCAALLAAPVLADTPAKTAPAPQASICELLAETAGVIMELRQAGATLTQGLSVVNGVAVVRSMVLDAWDRPAMFSAEGRARSIREFRDEWHLRCLRAEGA